MSAIALDQAAAALDGGDFARAARIAIEAVEAGGSDTRLLVVAGKAQAGLGDLAALENTADQLLAIEPRAVLGYIWKADCLAQRGEQRKASSFYAGAVRVAESVGMLSPPVARELQRAQRTLADYAARYVDFLDNYLRKKGFEGARRSQRIAGALAILTGLETAELAKQRPTLFYLPDLPQIEFYDRADFAWTPAIEAATDDIREELQALLAEDGAFEPYVTGDNEGPRRDYHGMLDNPDWSSFYLTKEGAPVVANVARCPKTAVTLSNIAQPRIPDRSPTAMFSRLKPGSHIPPHHGMLNTRLICHLPLIVPPGCGFRVGSGERQWKEGELLIFDDTIEHEAWNRGDSERVILLFDIERPEMNADENTAVAALFEAIDAFS